MAITILNNPTSGKSGATVYSRNRWGTYIRSLVMPTQPRTTYQLNQRGRIAATAASWKLLTDTQRTRWNALAGQITRTNPLGVVTTLDGYAAYLMVNNERAVASLASLAIAPTFWSGIQPTEVIFDCTGGVITMTCLRVGGICITATTDTYCLWESCQPQSAGASFARSWRQFAVTGPANTFPLVLTTAWTARFGAPPTVAGVRMFLRVRCFRVVDTPPATSTYVSTRVSSSVLSVAGP